LLGRAIITSVDLMIAIASSRDALQPNLRRPAFRPKAFVHASWRPIERLTITPGRTFYIKARIGL
jgi:hypothetical protein